VREMIDKLNEAMDTQTAPKPRKTVKK
jgi:hypothetical protein